MGVQTYLIIPHCVKYTQSYWTLPTGLSSKWNALAKQLMMQKVSIDRRTFLGEEFLGVFAVHDEFTRNLPQQLDDQCDVICLQ